MEMENVPNKNWLEKYEQIKGILKPSSKLEEYFIKNEICGKHIHILNMGNVNLPTGNIMVLDPLVYLTRRDEKPYFIKVPTGIFPLIAAVVEIEQDHYRYAAVKIGFNNNKVDYFTEALCGNECLPEDFASFKEGSFYGFGVDSGFGTIVDIKTRDAYCDFIEKWEKENPDKDLYDDFLAKEFKKNYKENPQYQREGGNWINYKIPETDLSVPMFHSGFGDGSYPVYFGYDKNNNICQVTIEFIDIELAFSEEDDDG